MSTEEASARLANMLNGRKVYKVRYIKSDKATHTYVVCKPEDMKKLYDQKKDLYFLIK